MATAAAAPKMDAFDHITAQILESLEQGVAPWVKPWTVEGATPMGLPFNAASKKSYRGMNIITLWAKQMQMKYPTAGWLSLKQANDLGGQVRKGEKATWVILWKFTNKKDKKTNEEKRFAMMRSYMVFNIAQCDGLPEDLVTPPPTLGEGDVENQVKKLGVRVRMGGTRACYHPELDYIDMPEEKQFKAREDFLSTLLHEAGHATGHKDRLNRDFDGGFGSESYAKEELIAEITSAFLCSEFGIPLKGLQHTEYLASWIKILKGDKKAIIHAASAAQRAADLIMGRSFEQK